jgi:hypothetical protein
MTDQERYEYRVNNAFEKFLISPFIEYDPYSIDDDRIIYDAKERSDIKYNGGRLQWMQSFASIYTIEGARPLEYNGKHFERLMLKPLKGEIVGINFSDFKYRNSFYDGEHSICFKFDESNARYINTVDDQRAIPESLAEQAGCNILQGYSFHTVNKYGSLRHCYRLYSLCGDAKQDANTIRRQILRAQAFALLIAAKYPVLCLPSNNYELLETYMYDITKKVGSQFTERIRAKLSEVVQTLKKHGLTYEDNI